MSLLHFAKYLEVVEEKTSVVQVDNKVKELITNTLSPEVLKIFQTYRNNNLNHNKFKPFSLSDDIGLLIRRGNLTININPIHAILQGAKWRIEGTTKWLDSGTTLKFLPVGEIKIEYSPVSNWTEPEVKQAPIVSKLTTVVDVNYQFSSPKGDLQVNLLPSDILSLGKWRIKGTSEWLDPGHRMKDVMGGQYMIEFYDLKAWFEPPEALIEVIPRQNNVHTYQYELIPTKGSLKVNISPQTAIDEGIRWRRKGTIPWLDSGYEEPGVLSGDYLIEFTPNSTFFPVEDKLVKILVEQLTTLDVPFTIIPTKGTLKVNLQPNIIHETLGGKWRRKGTDIWFLHGETETNIEQGNYELEFPVIEEWDSPATTQVTILPEILTIADCNYTYHPIYGDLQVLIEPAEAIAAGAKWRIVGTTDWLDSGTTLLKQTFGFYSVEFNVIPEWTKSDTQTYQVEPAKLNTKTATYTWAPTVGSLQVNILPQQAIDSNAKWRIKNSVDWFVNGYEKKELPGGEYLIEFDDPSPTTMVKPLDQTVTVVNGFKTSIIGTYGIIGTPAIIEENISPSFVVGKIKRRVPPTKVTISSSNLSTQVFPNTLTVPYRAQNCYLQIVGSMVIGNDSPSLTVSDPSIVFSGHSVFIPLAAADYTFTVNASTWFQGTNAQINLALSFVRIRRKDVIQKVSANIDDTHGQLNAFKFNSIKRKAAITVLEPLIAEEATSCPRLSFGGISKITRKTSIIIP